MPRQPFNRYWAESPSPNQFEEPSDATWTLGWEGGADKDPPEAKWENWWHNRADIALQQLERNGAMEWLDDVPYEKWAKSYGSDGNRYTSVQPNIGVNPVDDDGTNWVVDRTPSNIGFRLAENGWYSLPGGLIVQWFSYSTGTLGNEETFIVDFPIQFPNECFQVYLGSTSGVSGAVGSISEGMQVLSFTSSDVTCLSSWGSFPATTSNDIVRLHAFGC